MMAAWDRHEKEAKETRMKEPSSDSPKIKICGLTRPEDIEAACAARPDYIGFVFAPKSRRRVTPERAAALRAMLDDGVVPVGVFTDAAPDEIVALAACGVIEAAQLHGGEDSAYISRLRGRLAEKGLADVRIIKALSADSLFGDRPGAAGFLSGLSAPGAEDAPDYLLIDNGGGGTGRTFDWSSLRGRSKDGMLYPGRARGGSGGGGAANTGGSTTGGADCGRTEPGGAGFPFFLAGGIDEGNIQDAIAIRPYAIDVSSGAETDGVKDAGKIARLVAAVRSRRKT
jgi:phosphoribosylanthranilate isomerase